jgi:hypothetical protein
MFVAAVKEYLKQFPGIVYTLSPATDVWYISAGDPDLQYEIDQRVQELAEYYDCEDILDD